MKRIIKTIVLPLFLLVCFIGALLEGFRYFSHINEVQSRSLLEQSVRKAAIECYAIEGIYPSELAYLEEHYGIAYDRDKYGIEYGCWSSNVMPTIVVYEK